MKKAKVMLSVIAVLALVGGALAFKANKSVKFGYYFCNAVAKCQYTTVQGADPALTTSDVRTVEVDNAILTTSAAINGLNCGNLIQACTNTTFFYEPTDVQ
ncbi:MAG TPA: hypothetical protein VGN00_12730 [Puia sp.]|jgi:hypothetical protein